MTNYTELKKAAEAAQPWGSYGWQFFHVDPAAVLALLAENEQMHTDYSSVCIELANLKAEREKLLKVVEAAYTQTPPNQMLQAALKELEK